MPIEKPIHEYIRLLREERNLTQAYVAHKLGIEQRSYSRMERAEMHINLEHVEILATVFCIDATILWNVWHRPYKKQ